MVEFLVKDFLELFFTYKDKLIKLDRNLFSLLIANDPTLSRIVVEDYYKYRSEDFNNRKQIEILSSKQRDITLTKLPEGIITFKDIDLDRSPGIIIPYHKDHEKLEKLSLSE